MIFLSLPGLPRVRLAVLLFFTRENKENHHGRQEKGRVKKKLVVVFTPIFKNNLRRRNVNFARVASLNELPASLYSNEVSLPIAFSRPPSYSKIPFSAQNGRSPPFTNTTIYTKVVYL